MNINFSSIHLTSLETNNREEVTATSLIQDEININISKQIKVSENINNLPHNISEVINCQENSVEQLTKNISELKQKVAGLENAKVALDAQNRMLEKLLEMAATPELEDVLKITLEESLDIGIELTNAEHGCLILLSQNGRVREKVLKANDLTLTQQQILINRLIDRNYISWVAKQNQLVAIADTLEDETWQQLAQTQVARSALIVPILKQHKLIGIITLMHSQVGHFDLQAINLMEATVKQIALAIEYARFYGQLETELKKGREIQRDFLLELPIDLLPGWEFAALFQPARQVAGDFYDAFLLPNGSIGLVIGDVCDKGVGAALFMGLFRSFLRLFSGQHFFQHSSFFSSNPFYTQFYKRLSKDIDILRTVTFTNDYIAYNHSKLNMFATIFFGVLNPETGVLAYINAGHESPIIIRNDGTKERLNSTGPVVGAFPNTNFKLQQVQLQPGDILITYSDGIPDACNPQAERFTEKRLLSLLEEEKSLNVTTILERIKQTLESYVADADQFDDITILALQQSPLKVSS